MAIAHTRYEKFDPVATSHYGVTYDGHDLHMKRDVLILEIDPKFRTDTARWERMWQQIQSLADAKLENSVHVLDAYEPAGWVILEKMRGKLSDRVSKAPLQPDQVRGVLQQILESLKSLHEHDILHGEIEPTNLLYNHEGLTRLNFTPGLTVAGQILRRNEGFKYFAPELVIPSFGPVGPPTDLYSLGLSALELLCGPKYDGLFKSGMTGLTDRDKAWLRWHSSADEVLPPTKVLVSSLPEEFHDLANVIDRMIHKQVSERYQSADVALNDLKKAPIVRIEVSKEHDAPPPATKKVIRPVSSPPVLTRPTATSKPAAVDRTTALKTWIGQNPVLFSVIAGAAIVLLAMFISLFTNGSPSLIDVEFKSTPDGAAISLDDKPVESMTPHTLAVSVGKHTVTLEKEGYFPLPHEFELKTGDTALTLDLPLKRRSKKVESGGKLKLPDKAKIESPQDRLPVGLVAVENATIDPETKLPGRVIATRLREAGVPLELVLVKPKPFSFGVTKERLHPGELEAQQARIDEPYYISLTEISNGQYEAFALKVGSERAGSAWKASFSTLGEQVRQHPVVNVGSKEAAAFCDWVISGGRLPTEREWEFAARGDTNRDFPWEGVSRPNPANANLLFASLRGTLPVTSLPSGATPDGVLQMLGNVAEWCNDMYVPGFEDDAIDPASQDYHVIRGGSFKHLSTESIRVTMRAYMKPDGAEDVGIRLVAPALLQRLTPKPE